jgi:acetolactate decarboxylase
MSLRGAHASFALLAILASASPASPASDGDAVYQYSTIRALMAGVYDGDLSLGEASRFGDFGIGTVNAIDGELIAIGGHFFRVAADGRATRLPPETQTPFIVLKHFQRATASALPVGIDLQSLEQHLDSLLSTPNHFHAIRIQGHFRAMVTRSEPRQTPPYRPLATVMAEEQVTFQLGDVKGTLVGFRSPDFVEGLNVPGYHFHFLTADETRGGHVISLISVDGEVEIDSASRLEVQLPESIAFTQSDLRANRSSELDAVERGR